MVRFARTMVVALAVAGGCLVTAGSAAAQDGYSRPKRFNLFAVGGGYFASDIYTGYSGGVATGQVHISDAWAYGGRFVFYPERSAGLELGWIHSASDVSVYNPAKPLDPTARGTVNFDDIEFDILFLNRRGPAAGYFELGAGSTIITPNTPNGNTSSQGRFAWNFGIGVIYDTPGAMVARIDARYRAMDTNHSTGNYVYCDFYGFCYNYASDIYSQGEVTAALGFKF